jgi:amino acid transporter
VKQRHVNPGRAVILAVALLAVIYTLAIVGLQGAVSPARLANNTASALTYVASALGGGGWAKVMALSIALSAIASTGTGTVVTARIVYGMARRQVLPSFLGTVSGRFATPVGASLVVGLLVIAITWVYLLATTVQASFSDVVDDTGLLFSVFYILTALATLTYYRRRVLAGAWDRVSLGLLPVGAAAFLGWVVVKSMLTEPASQNWSMLGIVSVGVILMLAVRLVMKPAFFGISRESDGPPAAARAAPPAG